MNQEGNTIEGQEAQNEGGIELMTPEELDAQIESMAAEEKANAEALTADTAETSAEDEEGAESEPSTKSVFKIDESDGIGSNPYDTASARQKIADEKDIWKGTDADRSMY